jgi:hypothetical protein
VIEADTVDCLKQNGVLLQHGERDWSSYITNSSDPSFDKTNKTAEAFVKKSRHACQSSDIVRHMLAKAKWGTHGDLKSGTWETPRSLGLTFCSGRPPRSRPKRPPGARCRRWWGHRSHSLWLRLDSSTHKASQVARGAV